MIRWHNRKKIFLMWEYSVFLVNKKNCLMWEFFFFSEWSRWPWSPLFGRVFFPDFISCIIYFIVKKKQKKMLMWIKRSFVWLKKIVLDDSFYEIVFFSRTWLLSVLAEGWANVLSDLRFLSFFQWLDSTRWNTITVFFSVVVSAGVGFARVKWEYIYIFWGFL